MTDPELRVAYDSIRKGQWQDAQLYCRRLLLEGRDSAAVHHALGIALCGAGAFEEALPPLARAVELDPATVAWARDAAAVYAKLNRWSDAQTLLQPVMAALDAEALTLFLTAAIETNSAPRGLEALPASAVVTLREDPEAWFAYGRTLLAASRYAEAEAVLTECIARFGDTTGARDALARVFDRTQRGDAGLDHRRLAALAQKDDARAQLRLALACGDRGLWEECRDARKLAESLGLQHPEDHASRLYMMLSDPHETAETILSAAREAFDGVTTVANSAPLRGRAAGDRLRIGYLSSGFLHTPSFYFIHPFLSNHDRTAAEVFLYNAGRPLNFSSASVSGASLGEHYTEVGHLSESELGSLLENDCLDVLVHMAGHFSYSGFRLFCERLAPVQISYPHFPSTTGCPGVDYMITDEWTSPPGSEREYSERLFKIPEGCLVFAAPENGPPVAPVPRLTRGNVTFGMFQRLAKLNGPFCDALAAVLARAPGSRLLIHNGDAELDRPHSATARKLRERFECRGVDPERLDLRGPLGYHDHLRLLGQVDVALDSFPYNGQTTTCESMWMGVPLVTMGHGTHVSRVAGALLTRAGYPQWIAQSADEYAEIAASLAADVDHLVVLRERLRGDFVQAGLTDGVAMAKSLERAYEAMLRQGID